MYEIGQRLVYGMHGVCTVADLEIKTVDRQKVRYYVLEPLNQPGSQYYVPTENPVAVSKLKPLMTRQELEALLSQKQIPEDTWIPDENRRKQRYRELIGSADRPALLAMIRALHQHKQAQEARGKKFHLCDENFLRDAERLLSAEIALVLDMPIEKAGAYLKDHIA